VVVFPNKRCFLRSCHEPRRSPALFPSHTGEIREIVGEEKTQLSWFIRLHNERSRDVAAGKVFYLTFFVFLKYAFGGCEVDTSGSDWLRVGDFSDPLTAPPTKRKHR